MVTSRVLERGLVQRERRLRHRRAGRGARAPPEKGVQRLPGGGDSEMLLDKFLKACRAEQLL